MNKNVGTWDALMRITIGLVCLCWAIGRMSRWSYRTSLFTRSVHWLSAMKVAKGITRFCPMLYIMGTNTEGLTVPLKRTKTDYTTLKTNNPSPNPRENMEKQTASLSHPFGYNPNLSVPVKFVRH